MAADNKLELVVEIDTNRANASIKSVNSSLSSMEAAAAKSARGASAGIDGLTASMVKGAAAGTVLGHAFERAVGWLKEYGAEIVKYAARTQTLGVVTNQLAKVNDYNATSVNRLVDRIKQLGVSTQEAHGVVQRMIFAELDLSKATDLARVAQDAAVISGVNSSEALENIIKGITTGQTELLHTMGLQVSLEQVIQQETKKRGHALSEAEKREAMLNRVLHEGVKIRGVYEAAMGTAGKQMTSLTRLWQEAKNALGEQFLPEFSKLIKVLSESLEWVRKNSSEIASFVKIFGATAVGAAVGQFISWMAAARTSVLALNAAMALNPWIAGGMLIAAAGFVGYEQYQNFQNQQKAMEQDIRDATIRNAITKDRKSVDDLKKAGYSEQEIKDAFFGRRKVIPGFEDEIAADWKSPAGLATIERDDKGFRLVFAKKQKTEAERRAEEEARDAAKDRARKQAEFALQLEDEAVASRKSGLTGYARDVAEMNTRIKKGTTYLDKNGTEQVAPLTQAAWQSVLEIMRNKLAAWKDELHKNTVEYFRDDIKEMEEADNRRRELEGKQFQERLANNARIAEANLTHIETVYSFEERRAGFVRDAQLRAVDASDAQTIEQKVAVEQRKAAIEIEHITRVHEIRMRLFDLETSRMMLEEEATLKRLGYRVDEIQARIAELTAQRDEIKRFQQEATDTAVQGARESAAIRQAQIVRDQNQRIFDSFKRQAEGVFDALLTRSQSVWSAIGNSLKTALLTAIKDVVTSRVAAMLMQLFTGQRVGFAQASAGGGGVLGGLGGMLGVGAVPVFGGTSMPGATPPFVPSGSAAGTGGMLSKAGWGATLANLKSFAGIGGSVQLAPGVATTWEAATMGQKLSAIGKSNAALMGGAMLAMYGLQRGGLSGLAMTTAGGAMIGYKFGGPIGAAIGAGIGAVAGLVRLFVKGAQDKAREKIKATYGVDIRDKGVLKQIVDIAKQGFGGNLDMAIRSPQIRDLVELYALSTGQGTTGLPATLRPVSLLQQGGSLFQSSSGGLTLDRIGGGSPSSGAPTIINITVPGAKEFFEKETVRVVVENPRAVQSATMAATKQNAGRREMTGLQLSPGLIVS